MKEAPLSPVARQIYAFFLPLHAPATFAAVAAPMCHAAWLDTPLRAAFREGVQERYADFARPGSPDGPPA